MRIEVVSHCYAVKCPLFANALQYQISSLFLHQPRTCHVTLNVFYDPQDVKTMEVIMWGLKYKFERVKELPRVTLMASSLEAGKLGRRCIGRNIAAKQSMADLVWFTDCDHVFAEGAFDRLAAMPWPVEDDPMEGRGAPLGSIVVASMVYPKQIMISRDHATGDMEAAEAEPNKLVTIDPTLYEPKKYNRAIGGVQIVQGDFARQHGYLDGDTKWQQPTETPFGDFRDDVAYRKFASQFGPILGVDFPGVFRIRHSSTTYQEDKR
jgi:hypothetical protein